MADAVKLVKIVTSYAFRFIAGYVVGTSVVALLILAVIYAKVSFDYFSDIQQSVKAELEQLTAAYSGGNVQAVEHYIRERSQQLGVEKYYYLVVDAQGRKLAGNLDSWPQIEQRGGGWLSFERSTFGWSGETIDLEFVARSTTLANGERLLAARDYQDVIMGVKLVSQALLRSMGVMIVLGAIGGAVIATYHIRTVESLNRSLARIMTGDLSERIDTANSSGDFQRLIVNLNQMLDYIQTLMEGVKQVSDNIAHDLRTPLTRLRNHLAELEAEASADDREKARHLIVEADTMLGTFNALLRIADIETRKRRSGFEPQALERILADVVELYEPLAQEKAIQLHSETPPGRPVPGDRDLLFQAFANLLDNAIKYTDTGGRVSLQLRWNDNGAHITVADNGCGVPAEQRDHVFRRFFRVEASRHQPGNGLGLSLVLAVVRLHDGDIVLGDNHPGLRVEVTLPLKEPLNHR